MSPAATTRPPRPWRHRGRGASVVAVLAAAAAVLAGCATTTAGSAGGGGQGPVAGAAGVTTTAGAGGGPATSATTPGAAGEPGSTASAGTRVAAPGTCHARGSGLAVLPDPSCTPGATNPAVTPATIGRTICARGWTATVRPPESYTEPLKHEQMAAYGDTGPLSGYEEDHLIPLELGGAPASPANLWPEPGASPNPKDRVEDAAKRAVCDGTLTLADARAAIAANWIALGQRLGVTAAAGVTPAAGGAGPAAAGTCTVTASYDATYHDYDVVVRSDRPDQAVLVSASGGASAAWHTDGSGYADVYLHAPGNPAGQRVTATVGGTSCSTTLP